MMKFFAVLGFALAGLGAPLAQEATPAVPSAPADIRIDPAAPINAMPKQANLLTGLYATQAVIEICAITVPEPIIKAMSIDRKRFENVLVMDETASNRGYEQVKAEVQRTGPDCAEGSVDRKGVDAVLSVYTAR